MKEIIVVVSGRFDSAGEEFSAKYFFDMWADALGKGYAKGTSRILQDA